MPILQDPDNNPKPKPGEFPQATPPKDRAWLARWWRRNWVPTVVWLSVILVLLGVAIWMGMGAMSQPVKVQTTAKTQNEPYTVSANRTPTAPQGTTLPGAVPTFDPNTPPQGVPPDVWSGYIAYLKQKQQQTGQTQPQETPAEARRRKYDDLLWNARLARPDAGNTRAQNATTQAARQVSSPEPETSPGPAQPPANPQINENPDAKQETKLVNTCFWPEDGPGYRLLANLTPIKARILNSVNGDHKGPFIAETSQPVWSWDSQTLLIPKGSYLTGNAFPSTDLNQERIYLATNELTMPDDDPHLGGCQLTFPEMDVLDQTGQVGVKDQVNHHYAQIFLTAIAISGISAGASFSNSGGYTYSPQDALRIGVSTGGSQAAQQVLGRYAHRGNTLTLTSGKEIVIFLPIDITLSAWSKHHARTI